MFYFARMQNAFDFGAAGDIGRWRDRLGPLIRDAPRWQPRPPVGQLVKSMLSGRTRDAVSLAAYTRLTARYPSPAQLARSTPDEICALVADVTFAENKSRDVIEALRRIGQERGDYRLDFLSDLPLDEALCWLEQLPGVGRKVAASTLNASTLSRPVFIIDSHVFRVLQRLGFASQRSNPADASKSVTAAMPGWSGADFLDLHIGCKRLGQLHCHPVAPDCAACPLRSECRRRSD